MSDFLSQFTKEQYKKTVAQDQQPTAAEPPQDTLSDAVTPPRTVAATHRAVPSEEPTASVAPSPTVPTRAAMRQQQSHKKDDTQVVTRGSGEDTEFDPSYQRKRRRKWAIFGGVGVVVLLLLSYVAYALTHVAAIDLTGKTVNEARQWAAKNQITISVTQEFSDTKDAGIVLSQAVPAGQQIGKGSTLTLVASKGADPKQVVPLPDFSTMTAEQAQAYIDAHRLTQLKLVRQFSDDIAAGQWIKLEFSDSSVTAETYRRQDNAILYYSKGKETFEKNIVVPDFVGKNKQEVETWAKTNSLVLTITEAPSNTVEAGQVVSQSIAKDEKVAKKDAFDITVSLGKPVVVPDFSEYTAESAQAFEGLNVRVQHRFSTDVGYGNMLSQSVAAGTQLTDKDNKQVTVVYSAGKPYLRDLRGSMNEGELDKFFYDEFRAKGANITFTTYYVDSSLPKGTVATQSAYATSLPLTYTVSIGISTGMAPEGETYVPQTPAPQASEQPTDSDTASSN